MYVLGWEDSNNLGSLRQLPNFGDSPPTAANREEAIHRLQKTIQTKEQTNKKSGEK